MSALRRALHQCADLLADALEEDMAAAAKSPTAPKAKRPRARRQVRLVTGTCEVGPDDLARARDELRRQGLV